jgi:hypothetical protein
MAFALQRTEMNDEPFDPPPFKADEALATLKRHLRDLRLVERAGHFEWNGKALIEATLDGAAIRVRVVKQPASTPEWTTQMLKNGADVRKFTDDFKRQFTRWKERDE